MYNLFVNKNVYNALRFACAIVGLMMLLGVFGLIQNADWLFAAVNNFLAVPVSFLHGTYSLSQNLIIMLGLLFYFIVAFVAGLSVATIKTNSHESI